MSLPSFPVERPHHAGVRTPVGPRHGRPGRRRTPFLAAAFMLAAVPLAGLGVTRVWPGYAPLPVLPQVVVDNQPVAEPAIIDEAGRVLLSVDTLRAEFEPGLVWVQNPDSPDVVSIPTEGKRIRMTSELANDFVSRDPVNLTAPVTKDDAGSPYAPLDIFAALDGLECGYYPQSNTVVVDRRGLELDTGAVSAAGAYLRANPSVLATKLARLPKGEAVRILGPTQGWLKVMDSAGRLGYLPAKVVRPKGRVTVGAGDGEHSAPPPLRGRLSLVWEHSSGRKVDPATIGPMPGLSVVSPTWFQVVDSDGNVGNGGDQTYVDWAHEQGYQVWGLVTNGFSPQRTRDFLPDPAKREKIIRQLLIYARLYDLDGINMDFENMYLGQKEDYVQFMRELAPLTEAEGLTLSVDVTFLSSSEVWSRCYDRAALAEVCDYVMAMGYDEHTSGSDHSGSVGSLPWVENGLQRLLGEAGVPAEKLVLGVPFYTRLWGVVPGRRPTVTTYSMKGVRDLTAEKGLFPVWDEETRQYYFEFNEEGVRYRLWIEDAASMAERIRLIHRYGLAGLAAWRRGFEEPDIWDVIDAEL